MNADTNRFTELSDWLVNAFNGEWLKTEDPKPMAKIEGV